MIVLYEEEWKELYDLINELSGGNAGNCFAWDGTDDPEDPRTRALAKLFHLAGKEFPGNLKGVVE